VQVDGHKTRTWSNSPTLPPPPPPSYWPLGRQHGPPSPQRSVAAAPRPRRHCGATARGVLTPLSPPPPPPRRGKDDGGGTCGVAERAGGGRCACCALGLLVECVSPLVPTSAWRHLQIDNSVQKQQPRDVVGVHVSQLPMERHHAVPASLLPPMAKHRAQLKRMCKKLRPVQPPSQKHSEAVLHVINAPIVAKAAFADVRVPILLVHVCLVSFPSKQAV